MTTDYKTVFQLARDKGYTIRFDNVLTLPKTDNEYIIKRESYFLEISLIQKWLRDEYKIDIQIIPDSFNDIKYYLFITSNEATTKKDMSDSYEDALLNGVHEALKLI